jgi:hypothetical protein
MMPAPSSKILSYNVQYFTCTKHSYFSTTDTTTLTTLAYFPVRSVKHIKRHFISLQFLKLHLQRGREKGWSYHRGYVRLVIVHAPQKRHYKRGVSDCGTHRFVLPRSVGQLVCLWQQLSDSSTHQFECLYKPQTIYKSAIERR